MTINLLKGMGKAYQTYKRNKASKKAFKTAKGTTKLQHPVIKSVPVSKTVKKEGVAESIRRTKQDAFIKNIDEADKHKKAVKKGEEAKKKLEHMVGTKRAFRIGKGIHPSNPATGNK